MNTIDKGVEEEKKVVREQHVDRNIREGVASNYYQ